MKYIPYFIFLFVIPSITYSGELEDRESIKRIVKNMFIKDNFDGLSKLSKKYLETQERTSSGLWKLTLFYAGVGEIVNGKIKDKNYWNKLEKKALKWVESQPQSPSGYIAYAMILVERAWMYRGGGWARDVKKESWKPFYEQLEKAKNYLKDHYEIASTDPRWHETMIIIARSEGWHKDSFELLVNKSTKLFPYYYQLYFAAIDYLTPKWHGSKQEIEKFAQKSVNITKAHEKTGMYARVYWYASQTNYGAQLFTKSAVTWTRMSKAIDDVLDKYPDQWNINNFAFFSCLAGDKQKAAKLLSQVEGAPIIQVWRNVRFFKQCKSWSEQHQS